MELEIAEPETAEQENTEQENTEDNDACTRCGEQKPVPSINYEDLDLFFCYEVWQKNNGTVNLKIVNITENEKVIWRSENTSIADVDENGNVTPVKYGTTNIYGVIDGTEFCCKVKVKQIKVYHAREYTDSRLVEKLRWIEDADFQVFAGRSKKYKIIEVEYNECGEKARETDITSLLDLVPAEEGYFQVDKNSGMITAIKAGSTQEDGTTNIAVELPSYASNAREWGDKYRQVLMLKVFTKDEQEYFDKYKAFFTSVLSNVMVVRFINLHVQNMNMLGMDQRR